MDRGHRREDLVALLSGSLGIRSLLEGGALQGVAFQRAQTSSFATAETADAATPLLLGGVLAAGLTFQRAQTNAFATAETA